MEVKPKYNIGETVYYFDKVDNKIVSMKIKEDKDIDFIRHNSNDEDIIKFYYRFTCCGGVQEKFVFNTIKGVLEFTNKLFEEEIESLKKKQKEINRFTKIKYKRQYNIDLRIDKLKRIEEE